MVKAAERQKSAWAPGTVSNYNSSLRKYLTFCYNMQVIPLNPSHRQMCAYVEYVADHTPSPKTVANHMSHIRTYMRKCQASTAELDTFRVRWAMNALHRDTTYIPRIKSAFPVGLLQRMVSLLPDDSQGNILKVAVLVMFFAALRQSEVLPYSAATFDPSKHLSRQDVVIRDNVAHVRIKHAKNQQSVYQTKTVPLHSSPNQEVCVVRAIRNMLAYTPTTSPREAFILFRDTRRPVTVEFVRRNWVKHLRAYGVETTSLSLHSIRKAAATAAHDSGCQELDIQRYGGWRSNAHRAYISTSQTTVNAAIYKL